MYEATMENLSTLAKLVMTDGRTLMIAGDLDILHISAIAFILVFLMVRIAKKKYRSFFKSSTAESALTNNFVADRFFSTRRIPARKNCPNCAEQLPLSVLICNACDYNFLSRMVGGRHRLLPPPAPMTHEVSKPSFVSAGL